MSASWKTYGTIGGVLLVIIGWAVLLTLVPAERIVAFIGIENAYLVGFLFAAIAGFSSLTATSFYAAVGALSSGGANPILLGLASGVGLFISDSLFYALLVHGRKRAASTWTRAFERLARWMEQVPDWLVYAVVFLYISFAPIPNDILLAALAISGYRYARFFPFLLAGDLTFALLLTHLTQ